MSRTHANSPLTRAPWLVWLPATGWATVIFLVSAMPGSSIPGRFGNAAHVAEYMVLGALLLLPLSRTRALGRAAAIALLLASAYGATDELHQYFVPMRTPDVADWGRDTLGALLGVVLMSLVLRRLRAADTAPTAHRHPGAASR